MANQNKAGLQPGGVAPKFILGLVVAAAVAFALWSAFRTPASQVKPVATNTLPTSALPTQTESVAPPQPMEFDEAQVTAMPRISVDDAKAALANGSAVIIDVRDADSYTTSHIKGAMHIPVAYIAGEVPYLPRDKTIITYCT